LNDDRANSCVRSPGPLIAPESVSRVAEVSLEDGVRLLEGRGRRTASPDYREQAGAASEREPARVITMAWGDNYIAILLEITIPALLAPGNLPAFAAEFACEFVIVTETRLFDRIARSTAIAALLRFADLRLVPIDDLLSPWYGITLTYALVRGFSDLGEAMTRTHLVFLNADFIVADGSYRNLAAAIKRGERLVCAPSYCMNLEDTADILRQRRDKANGALSLPARDLAEIIIANRHNTIRAKTVNQQLFRIHRYDQFYWYVDEQTLLGRQMPIAVVYMRPERLLTEMPTFWDYGVISEYCPSLKPCVLGDSDDFLMAELRGVGTFRELFHLGWPSVEEIATDLSSFTTKDHRVYGCFTLVLHAGDLTPGVEAAKAELARFVDTVYARLAPPIGYRHHPFWAPQFPQFLARQQEAYRARRADEAARAALLRGDAGTAAREQRIRDLRARLLAGENAQQVAEQRLGELRRSAEARLTLLDEEHRRNRARLEGQLHQPLAGEVDALRRLRAELDLLAGEAADLERQQDRAVHRLRFGAADDDTGPPPSPTGVAGKDTRAGFLGWCGSVYRWAFGALPDTTCWHPYHTMLRPVMAAVAAAPDASGVLVLCSGSIFAPLIVRHHRGEKLAVTPAMLDSEFCRQDLLRRPKFGLCLCDLTIEELVVFRELFERIRPSLARQARIIIFHHNLAGRALDDWTHEFARGLFPLVGRSAIAFAGSYLGALGVQRLAKSLARHNIARPAAVIALAGTFALCAPLARLAAALERRRPPVRLPRHCTSMTIVIDLP
jgi:hypothetical protein